VTVTTFGNYIRIGRSFNVKSKIIFFHSRTQNYHHHCVCSET